MRRFVLVVAAGWVSAVAVAACPECINTNSSACNRWGKGRAFFKWTSDQNAGSSISLTATVSGSCGGSGGGGGESGKAYIGYVCDTHSNVCKGESPCDDGFSSKGAVAIIKVSGSKTAFKNTLGGLLFTGDKIYTNSYGGQYFSSVGVGETGCKYELPMAGAGGGRIKLQAGIMNLNSGSGGGKFNISVKFYEVLEKYGENDRYVLLAATEGSISVRINKSSSSDPVSFKPDLRQGSSMANYRPIYRYYSQVDGDTDWKLDYRGQGGESGCQHSEFWAGPYECANQALIPSQETFYRVKYPGYGSGVNGNPPYTSQGGWSTAQPYSSYSMLSPGGSKGMMLNNLMSGGLSGTVYMMHYDMGSLGKMYYRGESFSDGLRVRQIEHCDNGVNFGEGQILWTFCYDSLDRIQYIHNANYEDPNNQPDPNSPDDATAYYNYQYVGTGNDPTVTYYTRPNTQSEWIQQRNWELEFDSEGRAVKFQEGCSSGCGGTGTFEHIEYLSGHDDLITKQYNAAQAQILDNEYEEIEYGQYEPAGGIRITNGGFETPDVPAYSEQTFSSILGWELTGGPVKIYDPNTGSGSQYLEFSNQTEQTLSQEVCAISSKTFYTLEAKIRAHNLTGKYGLIKLMAVKDGYLSQDLAAIEVHDPNLPTLNWTPISVEWNSKDREDLCGVFFEDLWFLKIVVTGLKVDVDDVTLSTSIWVGNKTKPIVKEQMKANSQGQLVRTLERSFDKPNKQIIERTYIDTNSCRVIKYDYEDETFTNILKKTEWQNPGTASTLPTGTSYETNYSNDANNVINLPGGKRADWELYGRCGKVSKTYRHDRENDANAFMEQYEYYVDEDNGTITDSRLKKHTNAAGGVTDYEYYGDTKLLKKKTDPQTAAGRLVTEYTYDGARRLTEEKKSKLDDSSLLHRTVNHYNSTTGYLDYTEEIGGYNRAVTTYKYNSLGQVIRQTNPDGVQTGKSYGSGGQLVSEFTLAANCEPNQPDDELSLISQTLYTYTHDGQIEKIGKVKTDGTFNYKTAIDDPADPNEWVITKYEYYPDGKQWKVIEDFGGANLTTEYFYNLQGEVEKVIYPTGKWVKTTRDGRGLVTFEYTGHSADTVVLETAYGYDADGNLIQQDNPDGTTQIYEYNNFGQLKKVIQNNINGPYTEKFYDNAGNVIRELSVDSDDTLLRDIHRRYDSTGNLKMERICAEPNVVDDTADVVTWYKYDVLGNLQYTVQDGPNCFDPNSITDPNNIVTEYIYDGLGRKQKTLSPVGVLSSVFYTPGGLPETIVDPNDPQEPNDFITDNFYDAAGRLEKSVDPEGHYTVNTYNSLNQLIRQTVFDCNETPDDTGNDFAVRQTRTQYDNLGNVIRQVVMKNPNSQSSPVVGEDMITDYVYEAGLLRQVSRHSRSGLSQTETYYYDGIGRKYRTVDAEGNEDIITYSQDRPTLVEKTERLENNPGGNDYTITTFFDYDDFGRLYKRILDLDGNGEKEITDTTTEYLYDGLGRLISETAPDGIVTFTSYDGFGNVRQKIEDYDLVNSGHFNKTTEYVYNRLNRLDQIKAYDPNDTTTQIAIQTTFYEYDKAGAVRKITYPDEKCVEYIYNIQNKLDTEIQRNGKWIAYWYDENRNLIQVSDYDQNDPNWPTEGPATFIETFSYDAAGNLKTADKVEGENAISHSEFTYNGFGLKTSETATYFDLEPVTTTWDYDGSGNLISQSSIPMSIGTPGCVLSYTHDGLGRIKTIDRGEDRIVNYNYIGSGTKAIEYPEPQITQSYSYDELGRVDGVGSVDGQDNTILDFVYDYDTVDNRRSEEYHHLETPVWDKFYYDNLRRLNQVDYAADTSFALINDLLLFASQWLNNETLLATETLEYTEKQKENNYNITSVPSVANNIYSLAEFGGVADTEPNVRTENIYDDNGNITAQIVYDSQDRIILFAIYPDSGGKVVITSYYDTSGNMTSNICTTYDAEGNVVSREEMPLVTETAQTTATTETVIPNAREESVDSATSSFSQADLWLLEAELLYDGGPMLMSSPSGPSFAWTNEFVYDHLGNRYQSIEDYGLLTFTHEYSHNIVNQYQTISEGVSEMTTYTVSYDDNGNLEMDQNGFIYTYDYRNRLVSIGDGVTTIAEYVYDALGRRISKTTDGTTTYFYYDTDNRVIAQHTQEQGEDVKPDRTFVFGNEITEVLAMFLYEKPYSQNDVDLLYGFFNCWLSSTGNPDYNEDYDYVDDNKIDLKDWSILVNHAWNLPEPVTNETRFYYLTDALGSVRGLIGGRLNQEEDREFYNYDVYGASSSPSAAGNPILFAGYRNDPESGLYHLGNRSYEPVIGRFLQFDPIADSVNLYEYANNSPMMYIDPFGLSSCTNKELDAFQQAIKAMDCKECNPANFGPEPSEGSKGDWGGTGALAHYISGRLSSGNSYVDLATSAIGASFLNPVIGLFTGWQQFDLANDADPRVSGYRQFGSPVEFSHESEYSQYLSNAEKNIGLNFWPQFEKKVINEAKGRAHSLVANKCTTFPLAGNNSNTKLNYGITAGRSYWDDSGTLANGRSDNYSRVNYTGKCCLKKSCSGASLKCRIRFNISDLYTWDSNIYAHYAGKDYWQTVHFDRFIETDIDLNN